MKFSECKHGMLVVCVKNRLRGQIAMIVGISQNNQGEAIPLVQWQFDESEPFAVHHSNFEIYGE